MLQNNIYIDGLKVYFLEDGGIQVGCTTVSKETLTKIIERLKKNDE